LISDTIDAVMVVASVLAEIASMRSGTVSGTLWAVSMTGVVTSTTVVAVSTTSRMTSVMFEEASSTITSASAAL
jgi:hypothetical protein